MCQGIFEFIAIPQLGTYVGVSPSTPCSDGKYVYVFTGYNCVACYDLNGQLRWMRWLGMPAIRRTSWIAWCQPPILSGDQLLIGAPLIPARPAGPTA